MGWQPALVRVELEIAEGKLGIARDRLHGLVLSFPNDITLRSRLGDVYSRLGYPVEAGRFWFFDEDLTDEKREAIALFIGHCKGDAALILEHLKVRCDPSVLSTKAAQKKVRELVADCERRGIDPPTFKCNYHPNIPRTFKDKLGSFGCAIAVVIFFAVLIIGIVTAFRWVGSLF